MFNVIGCMLVGILVGYTVRHIRCLWISSLITRLIWALLFLLGWEVGSNEQVISALPSLGWDALLITLAALLGSLLAAWILWKVVRKRDTTTQTISARSSSEASSKQSREALKGNLCIVGFFLLGIVCGLHHCFSLDKYISDISFYALCALMFSVGASIGNNPDTIRQFKTLHRGFVWLPLATILGTWCGCLIVSLLLRHSTTDCLAIGSGFGYYSLSSILITESKGAELGTIALLSNIIREIITLLAAPLPIRLFGSLAPIAAGGATTADTTLPVISRCCGQPYAMLSIYHGFVVDFSVPFLVTLFCSL